MKKVLFSIVGVIALALSFQSCEEDIVLLGDFEETAVVYGILDQSDSLHMIKITRAFIGPGNALEISQIPDSNYFESVVGTITEYVGGTETNQWTLKDTTVDNKDPNGVFYAPTQKLYYFISEYAQDNVYGNREFLNPNARYVLDLDINNGEFQVSGETQLVSGLTHNLSPTQPYRFANNDQEFLTTPVTINTGNAYRTNVTITGSFTEWVGTAPTIKTFDWTIGETEVLPSTLQTYTANGQTFYNKVIENCSSDVSIDKRTYNSMTTTIVGAAEDFVTYININEPSSGLAQNKPSFTNLEATGSHPVVGIFSSKQTIVIYNPFIDDAPVPNSNVRCIDKNTTRKLCTGGVDPFFFCSDHPADIASSESWICN